jgi:hypothetical protein
MISKNFEFEFISSKNETCGASLVKSIARPSLGKLHPPILIEGE